MENEYIKSLLEEVGLTITGKDAFNIIPTLDTHNIIAYRSGEHFIQYILTVIYVAFEQQFAVLLNIKDNNTFLTDNIILSYAPNKFLAEKAYAEWLKEIKTYYPTKFFCQRDYQFYSMPELS